MLYVNKYIYIKIIFIYQANSMLRFNSYTVCTAKPSEKRSEQANQQISKLLFYKHLFWKRKWHLWEGLWYGHHFGIFPWPSLLPLLYHLSSLHLSLPLGHREWFHHDFVLTVTAGFIFYFRLLHRGAVFSPKKKKHKTTLVFKFSLEDDTSYHGDIITCQVGWCL